MSDTSKFTLLNMLTLKTGLYRNILSGRQPLFFLRHKNFAGAPSSVATFAITSRPPLQTGFGLNTIPQPISWHKIQGETRPDNQPVKHRSCNISQNHTCSRRVLMRPIPCNKFFSRRTAATTVYLNDAWQALRRNHLCSLLFHKNLSTAAM